jgi:SAM-dependent methyltransferase
VTDAYAAIAAADPTIVRRLAEVLETRAAEPDQRQMLEAYLAQVPFPHDAHVLEIGCGTGAIARALARWPRVADVQAVDPSPVFLELAQQLTQGFENVSFRQADGRNLPFESDRFDVVVFHTSLCHIPEPDRALDEAHRVLRPGGCLVIFDGANDPLQTCVDAAIDALVHDPWLVRRLPALVATAGFKVCGMRSHGYVQTIEPTYMRTLVDRGADFLVGTGRIGEELGGAMKAEAVRRVEAHRFFGHIAYASLLADKPLDLRSTNSMEP